MVERFDVYFDAFNISVGPLGTSLALGLAAASLFDGSEDPTDLGVVRMSNEQLKLLAFALWDNVKELEASLGTHFDVSKEVTDQLELPRDIWDSFWAHERG